MNRYSRLVRIIYFHYATYELSYSDKKKYTEFCFFLFQNVFCELLRFILFYLFSGLSLFTIKSFNFSNVINLITFKIG